MGSTRDSELNVDRLRALFQVMRRYATFVHTSMVYHHARLYRPVKQKVRSSMGGHCSTVEVKLSISASLAVLRSHPYPAKSLIQRIIWNVDFFGEAVNILLCVFHLGQPFVILVFRTSLPKLYHPCGTMSIGLETSFNRSFVLFCDRLRLRRGLGLALRRRIPASQQDNIDGSIWGEVPTHVGLSP